ncbi:tetratricopeptide repeat protein [Caenimonas sedimenti]|uniref:Tetratricopeptide repeat protein n=1 Tax=Caenimonas sedimenti TaxID=2596921 RepID=A0A562ZXX9_9BURK|nr:tetratricopeptide repeat protein [Caenimonas sedimenti]TWO73227.1 tetratricopeptide repeat protein [Caenimonas sedimenti]
MTFAEGGALLAAGRFHEARAAFVQALQREPQSVPARIGLAQALAGGGDKLSATAWLTDACRIAPGEPTAMQLLADLLLAQRQYAQAAPIYRELLERLGLRNRANLLHAGYCLEQAGKLDGAAQHYRDALALDASFLEAHVDLAGILWRMEDFEGSLAHAQRAVQLAPDHPYAVRILGTALLNLNRLDEAERVLRQALDLQPGFALAQLDLAFTLLLAGRLQEGWAWYEHRWRDTERVRRPAFYVPHAEWQGARQQPVAGQDIAVYAEQGLGDVIQAIRYVPQLEALGARVHCVIQPELVPVVQASFPRVHCLAPGENLQVHVHAALMELPGRFDTALATIPAPVSYLQSPEQRRPAWRERLRPAEGRFKLGLCWSGAPGQVNNRNRGVPLSLLEPFTRLPGVQCYSLQKGDAAGFTDAEVDAARLVDLTPEWRDFGDSAAMIEQLDLVVTVDTVIAHLAGALGKPVWILLPPNADWRWLLEREDSPWYPSARLFRRGFGEPRAVQVGRVMAALQQGLGNWPAPALERNTTSP